MSVWYFLQIGLDMQYMEKNILYILKEYEKYGLIYFSPIQKSSEGNSYFIEYQQAARHVLMATDEMRDRSEDALVIKYKDTYFKLQWFKQDDKPMILSMYSFSCPWIKDFWYGEERTMIDFSRYIELVFHITNQFSISYLIASADDLEGFVYDNSEVSAVVVIDMGVSICSEKDNLRDSIGSIVSNALQNRFILVDENTNQLIEPSIERYYETFKAGFPVYLYAKKDDVLFKFEIKRMQQGCDFVSIYPLEPYRMKKGYGSEEEKIDVAFYVQRLLELCENFAIYELKTFL
jgi:hypothetical protein